VKQPEPFNWAAAMAFGLGVLKLPPAAFWALTPRELDAALAGHYGRNRLRGAPNRADLQTLMAAYPDEPVTEHPHNEQP